MKKLLSIALFTLLLVSLVSAQGGTLSGYEGKQIGDPDVSCSPGYARDFEKVCVPITPVSIEIDYSIDQGFSGEACKEQTDCLFGFECNFKTLKCERTSGYGYSGDLCKRQPDCRNGFICNIKTHFCEKGATYGGTGDLCKSTLDCQEGFSCNTKKHVCEAIPGSVGSSCKTDDNCNTGLLCDKKTLLCSRAFGDIGDSCGINADCKTGLICNPDTNTCQSYDLLKEQELQKLIDKERKTATEKDREIDLLNEKIKQLEDQMLDAYGNKALLQKQLDDLRDLLAKEKAQEQRREAFLGLLGSIKDFVIDVINTVSLAGWIILLAGILIILFFIPCWECHECGNAKAPLRRCKWNKPVVSG